MTSKEELGRLISEAEKELVRLDARRIELLERINQFRSEREQASRNYASSFFTPARLVTTKYTQEEKISLFRSLFKGRDDVYPKRFESARTGKTGYQPACRNEWVRPLCSKPAAKCVDCLNREFIPLTDEVIHFLHSLEINLEVQDERAQGVPVEVKFQGALRPEQEAAVQALLNHDIGVLSASTAFGKTIVASYLIAERKVNTLILVHRRQLLDQWISRLSDFLGLDTREIGQIGGGKRRVSGRIDVAILQSLTKKGIVDDLVGEYGYLIVDECHHISARSFEVVARQCKAKYVTGLSATVTRKDGHHPIIFMQCGPIRYRVDDRRQAAQRPFEHKVTLRRTNFKLPHTYQGEVELPIQEIYSILTHDEQRNNMIVEDVLKAVAGNRSPLVLTERKEHLALLVDRLSPFVRNVIVLKGGMGPKQRQQLAQRISEIPDEEERLLISTGRYLGEGFDDARLDTLFLALPVSWRGTLAQYAGRLHRLHDRKREVLIYDYADLDVRVLARMFERRRRGYKAIGYDMAP